MTGTTPTLDMTNCMSNDTGSGLLTPVSQFISDIKALKTDPDNQILVAAITGAGDAVHGGLAAPVGRPEHPARRALAVDRALVRRGRRG